ncbi:MAG TPA: CHRD domain-containing protein [Gaiellaceae bacterium]|nr:CHRD domain-containing protein [Gaiellaceae bacterium]
MSSRRSVLGAVALPAVLAAGVWTGLGLAGASADRATTTGLTARLSGAQEAPRPTGTRAAAVGTFTAALVRSGAGGTLSWRLTFRDLTGKATASHIHVGTRGKAGPVRVSLCGPCRSGAAGSARVDARTLKALIGGGTYVNVHTARNPGGEIRGQITKSAKAPVVAPPTTQPGTTNTGTTEPYPEG